MVVDRGIVGSVVVVVDIVVVVGSLVGHTGGVKGSFYIPDWIHHVTL